jgi:hypothetical protein
MRTHLDEALAAAQRPVGQPTKPGSRIVPP